MSSPRSLFSFRRFFFQDVEHEERPSVPIFGEKVIHPLACRLREGSETFDISTPKTLSEVGFSCWALGMLTIFRPCFLILISIIPRIKKMNNSFDELKISALHLCYGWIAVVIFVLFVVALIPIFSGKIKKRWILLIHPWALLLMYFDVVVWLSITTYLYIALEMVGPAGEGAIIQVKFTALYILAVYFDILIYFIVYYVFITFYIVAQITLIEKFF